MTGDARKADSSLPELPAGAFDRADETDDALFYAPERLVTHIDDRAIAALSDHYAQVLPPEGVLFDLMSSWISHLPGDLRTRKVIGHGMNARELAANPGLDDWFVQNLNRDPALPLPDSEIDAAMCCVSVQYLQRPVEVFAEVRRVLRPGAPFVVSYANRCFPTKAVAIWRGLDFARHAALVSLYLERSGFTGISASLLADGSAGDPIAAVFGRA